MSKVEQKHLDWHPTVIDAIRATCRGRQQSKPWKGDVILKARNGSGYCVIQFSYPHKGETPIWADFADAILYFHGALDEWVRLPESVPDLPDFNNIVGRSRLISAVSYNGVGWNGVLYACHWGSDKNEEARDCYIEVASAKGRSWNEVWNKLMSNVISQLMQLRDKDNDSNPISTVFKGINSRKEG